MKERDEHLLELEKEEMAKAFTNQIAGKKPHRLTFTARLKLRSTANNLAKKGK